MAGLATKLGVRAGFTICLLDAPTEAARWIQESCPEAVQVSTQLELPRYDLILFWPQRIDGLAEVFASLQHRIHPDGAIWAVMPKAKYAAQRGIGFTWEQMQAAGLQTDLVDNKTATISEQDYGTRFVIRKRERDKYMISTVSG